MKPKMFSKIFIDMAKRILKDRLIKKEDIGKELGKIQCSDVDYVTKDGEVYCDYGNNMFLKKRCTKNKYNGYMYVSLKSRDQGQIGRRVHRLVAEAFLETSILYQAKHYVKDTSKKPKCKKYFRFLDEYNDKGFVL